MMRYALLASVLIFKASGLFALDSIVFSDGREKEALVISETSTKLKFKDAETGVLQSISVDDVDRILYEDADKNFALGLNAIDAKDYSRAYKAFSTAKKKMKKSRGNWHFATLDYYLAYALFEFSKKEPKARPKSVKQLEKVVAAHKASRFSVQAKYLLGQSWLIQKKYSEALGVFSALAKNVERPAWAVKAVVAKGHVLVDQEKFDEALSSWRQVLDKKIGDADLLDGVTDVLIDIKKDYKQAKKIAQPFLCSGSERVKKVSNELYGCAEFGLGRSEEALPSLLRSTLLYDKETYRPRSNLFLALTLQRLMKKNPERYPSSRFGRKLQDCMRKMTVAEAKRYKAFN